MYSPGKARYDTHVQLLLVADCFCVSPARANAIIANNEKLVQKCFLESWFPHQALRWRNMNFMQSQITGHLIVCLAAYAELLQRNIKVPIADPVRGKFTSNQWIPYKGPVTRKKNLFERIYLMTSSLDNHVVKVWSLVAFGVARKPVVPATTSLPTSRRLSFNESLLIDRDENYCFLI